MCVRRRGVHILRVALHSLCWTSPAPKAPVKRTSARAARSLPSWPIPRTPHSVKDAAPLPHFRPAICKDRVDRTHTWRYSVQELSNFNGAPSPPLSHHGRNPCDAVEILRLEAGVHCRRAQDAILARPHRDFCTCHVPTPVIHHFSKTCTTCHRANHKIQKLRLHHNISQ